MTLSLYDSMMLGIVIFCVIHGAIKGMAWQVAPIASLVLGYLFGTPLSAATAQWFGQPPLNRVFSLIAMYMLVSLGVYLVARSLRETIEKTKMMEFDRHLGALLGGVKGVLFTTVVTVGLVCVSPSMAAMIVHSESRTIAEKIIGYVGPLLPPDVHKVIDPYLQPIENLPDDPAPSMAGEDDPFPQPRSNLTQQGRTPFTPRNRTRNPIYEDDQPATDDGFRSDDRQPATHSSSRRRTDDFDPANEEPAPRRRRPAKTGFESAEDDNPFGDDPSQALEEKPSSRRR